MSIKTMSRKQATFWLQFNTDLKIPTILELKNKQRKKNKMIVIFDFLLNKCIPL